MPNIQYNIQYTDSAVLLKISKIKKEMLDQHYSMAAKHG